MAVIDIVVPDLGNFKDVEVTDVLVKPGEQVEVDTPLLTLETDKATMDVPASAGGTIESLTIAKGGRVSTGDVIGKLRTADGASAAAAPAAATAPVAAATATPAAKTAAPAATPAAATAVKPAPATTAAAEQTLRIVVPDLGNFKGVEVIDVLVKVGDRVAAEAPILTLETEKATMDVPAPAEGVITAFTIQKGGKVSAGDVIGEMRAVATAAGAAAPASAAAAPAAAPSAATAPAGGASASAAASPPARPPAPAGAPGSGVLPPINESGFARAHAGPSVRAFARELGVDLARLSGTGRKQRITVDDVKAFVKAVMSGAAAPVAAAPALPKVPVVDFAQFGPVEVTPLTRIQKISGPRLHASWINLPHVTQFDQADITAMEEKRKALKAEAEARGVKLTPLAFILRACVLALKEHPRFNASLDAAGENLVLKKYCHLGFAADTPNGLVVPVIRDADKLDVFGLAKALADLSDKARKGRLGGAEMQGGCFTVSSLGGIGGTAFTPIINAPEVAILGVSRSSLQPVWKDKAFEPRLMLPLSLSYDHRVIDGAAGARFSTALTTALANVEALLAAPA